MSNFCIFEAKKSILPKNSNPFIHLKKNPQKKAHLDSLTSPHLHFIPQNKWNHLTKIVYRFSSKPITLRICRIFFIIFLFTDKTATKGSIKYFIIIIKSLYTIRFFWFLISSRRHSIQEISIIFSDILNEKCLRRWRLLRNWLIDGFSVQMNL